ncbi:MAG: hypothetical protein ACOY35_02040 [Bacillota bacterium]
MKKLLSVMIVICMFLSVTSPALAKKGGGFKSGGFSKPKTTTNDSAPAQNPSGTTKSSTETGSGDKIPYTNLPSSKVAAGAGAGAAALGKSNLSGYRPSFFPFSGNFWMWMFLMSSFGNSQPAAAQTQTAGETTTDTAAQEDQQGIYTPTMGDYWEADPLANTISTAILLAIIALPVVLFLRWRKKRLSY